VGGWLALIRGPVFCAGARSCWPAAARASGPTTIAPPAGLRRPDRAARRIPRGFNTKGLAALRPWPHGRPHTSPGGPSMPTGLSKLRAPAAPESAQRSTNPTQSVDPGARGPKVSFEQGVTAEPVSSETIRRQPCNASAWAGNAPSTGLTSPRSSVRPKKKCTRPSDPPGDHPPEPGALGFQDETWWSRLAQAPARHALGLNRTSRLAVGRTDGSPQTGSGSQGRWACYGPAGPLGRTCRVAGMKAALAAPFVDGRPRSARLTTAVTWAWCLHRPGRRPGKDGPAADLGQRPPGMSAVQCGPGFGGHNRTVKLGRFRPCASSRAICRGKSPWLNAIEAHMDARPSAEVVEPGSTAPQPRNSIERVLRRPFECPHHAHLASRRACCLKTAN